MFPHDIRAKMVLDHEEALLDEKQEEKWRERFDRFQRFIPPPH